MARREKARIESERAERRRTIETRFRARHPAVARAERGFRKSRKQREDAHSGRDRMEDGGTPETRAKAARIRQGSLARAYEAGHITLGQLASAQQIRGVAERLARDVAIGTVSLETRVDQSRSGTGAFFEALGAVRAEVAYKRWCAELGGSRGAAAALAMILEEASPSAAARRFGMRKATARRALSGALDLWGELIGEACKAIDREDLEAMHRRLT